MDSKSWEKIRNKLPEGYDWGMQFAGKVNRKGKARGGIIMGIRKKLKEKKCSIRSVREGMVGRVKVGKERWRIVGVYVRREEIGKVLRVLDFLREERGEEWVIIMDGDFNVRIGDKKGKIRERENGKDEEGRVKKQSKDKMVDREEKVVLDWLREKGLEIFNRNIEGDIEGEFTFTGGIQSLIM